MAGFDDFVGWIAVDSHGDIGLITGYTFVPGGSHYIGIKLDGAGWASQNPTCIAKADQELIDRLTAKHKAYGYGEVG